jgi:hypothetical protein
MKKISFLVLLFLSSLWGYSQVWDENFNYGTTTDTLDNPTKGGVNWKRHSGATPMMYNTTSLSFPNYPLSGVGGSAEILNPQRAGDVNRNIPNITSGSVYASFLFKLDSVSVNGTTGDYFIHFSDTSGATSITNFKARVFVKYSGTPNTYKIGLSKAGTGASVNYASTNYSFGTTYMLVLKYKFDLSSASNDSVSLYIFDSSIPSQEPTTATLVGTDISSDFLKIQSLCLRQGSGGQYKGYVDGIRISTTWGMGSPTAAGTFYWREPFTTPSQGGTCDLTTTVPSINTSGYFSGSNSGVWWGKNVYNTTGTGCPAGNPHVRFKNISGVTDSGQLVTPLVNDGIKEFYFYRARSSRHYSIWVTNDTSALTNNWTLVANLNASAGTLICVDTMILVNSATAKRLRIKASPGTDSDIDSIGITRFSAATSSSINASVTVGAGGDYTSFTNPGGLFEAINSLGLNQSTVATVIGNTNELGTHSLNQFNANYSLTIRPDAATLRTIDMVNPTSARDSLFKFNGADNVIINGSFNGSGRYLLFRCANANTDSTGSVFVYRNDARENSISNCIIESNSQKKPAILLHETNGLFGNDGFTFYGNLVRESTGANAGGYVYGFRNLPHYTASYAQRNSRLTLRKNQFTGFASTSGSVYVINSSKTGDSLIIDSNQIYIGSNFALPNNFGIYCIQTDEGYNATISYNSIGGSNPNRSGNPISLSGQFFGININSTDTGGINLVNDNRISNITNKIGSNPNLNPISVRGDKIFIENNVIGGLENPWDTIQGSGNMISAFPDGFQKPDTTFVRNNIVSHIKYVGKVPNNLIGISISKVVSNAPEAVYCSNNLVSDLFSNAVAFTSGTGSLTGINFEVPFSGSRNAFCHNNIIKNLSHKTDTNRYHASHIAGIVNGIYLKYGPSTVYNSHVYKNKIYNLTALNTNAADTGLFATQINGINCNLIDGNLKVYNNQISLVAPNTSAVRYLGIVCKGNNSNFQGNLRIVHNSVLLSGNSVSNGVNGYSSPFSRELKQTVFVRNNIFVNARTGTNTNFAIVNDSLSANWVDTSCQHNLYVSSNANQMGLWANRTNPLNFASWKSASNSDSASTYFTSSVIDPASFFTDFANCDLSIKSAMRNYAAGKGYPENSVTVDYVGNARSTSTPSLGAFEYSGSVPPTSSSIKINQIIPEYGLIGSTVTIKGSGFNTPASDNIVQFGSVKASITSGNDSTLVVTVPLGAKASELMVANQSNDLSARSKAIFRPMFAPQKINLSEADFLPSKSFAIVADNRNIISADFDGDGKLDVAGATTFPDSLVSVLRNTSAPGQISFAPSVTFISNGRMNRIYARDLNGDGKAEIITSNFVNAGISVFPNNSTLGNINFGTRIDFITGSNPVTIVFDDFDGNGKTDIAVTNQLGSSLSVLRNTSVGGNLSFVGKNFSPSILGYTSCMGLTSNDFNNDGKIDLAITFPFANKMKILKNASLIDSIHFIPESVIYTTDTFVRELHSGDLNGDGKPEILTYSTTDKKISVYANLGIGSQFALNDTFTYKAHQNIYDLRLYNVDGDSMADLALYTADSILFLKNTSTAGNYSFEYFGSKYVNGDSRFEMADIDNDHKVDLLVTGGSGGKLRVFRHIYPISNNNISGTEAICAAGATAQITGSTVVNNYLIPYTNQWIKSTTSATTNYSITSAQDTAKNYPSSSISSNTWFKRVYIWDYTYDTTNVAAKTITNLGSNTITGNQQVNAGQNASQLNGSSVSGVTYLWLSSADSLTGYAAAAGTNNTRNYTPGVMNQTTFYKRVITSAPCSDTSAVVKITVTASAINNQITSGNQAICKGSNADSVLANIPTGLTAPISYQWIRSTVGATGPYSAAPGVNNQRNYFPGGLNQSIWLKRIAMDASTSDTSGYVFLEAIDLSANTINGNQLIITGQTPNPISGSNLTIGGSFSYKWLSANALVGPFTAASGKNDTVNYAPGALTQTTFYKRAVLTSGCNDTSNVVSIIVGTPGISLNIISGNQNICSGVVSDTLKGSVPVGGNPPYQYVWLSSTTSATAGFGAASGTNNTQNYLAGALAQTTWFKRVAMDGTNSDTSNVVAITITATPAKPVISTKPLAPVCLGTNYLNFGANAAPASGVNYNWTTENALVYAQGNTRQFSLISFNAAGKAKVILTASANGCSSKDEVEYDITSDVSHLATVRYFNKNFVCEANMVNKYQWGYDMQPSLEGALVNGEINQNYFNATPDFTNRNYWAISATATCYQKTYYNKPTDVRENSMNENGLMVYPNPVNNQLNIKHSGAKGSMVVQVLDMHGKICQEVLSVQTETTINIEALAPGVYLVRCVLENDVVVNTKVVKN